MREYYKYSSKVAHIGFVHVRGQDEYSEYAALRIFALNGVCFFVMVQALLELSY